MCTAVNDIMTKQNQKVIQGINIIKGQMTTLNGFLANCPNASAAITTTEGWAKYWSDQPELKVYSTAYKNLTSNMSTVTADAN